ncbi:MAG: hypothetical protein M1828_004202 [Chrysothrix sp. TS-e1954]|nr:MAG: hypothetical protein M1828_004202 [Chrysothrix sp. TS-e1954]
MNGNRSPSEQELPPSQHDYHTENEDTTEDTPLLSRENDDRDEDDDDHQAPSPHSPDASSLLRSLGSGKRSSWGRWPTFVALSVLSVVVIVILVLGFVTPDIVKEYANQALIFEPTSLSVDSFTKTGIVARVQGDFRMDASRVKKKSIRDLGRFGTSIAKKVETGDMKIDVMLPEYGNLAIGSATVPPITVDIRNGHETQIDFLSEVEPGSFDGLRRIASDWIDGRLGELRVQGNAVVPLKSGIFSLGKHKVSNSLVFKGNDIPTLPQYDIKRLNFRETSLPKDGKGLAAEVSIDVKNDYPFDFEIPPLGFAILVDNCLPSDPHIMLAEATTESVKVLPKKDVQLNVTGFVRHLPEPFLSVCPGSNDSPMDSLVNRYITGKQNTVFVSGSDSPSPDTPAWISKLLYGVTVPVPITGHALGHLIKNFSMSDVHFSLPDFFAEPETPEAQPKISAEVKAVIALPEEINFPVDVHRIRSNATVFYQGNELGILDLRKWHKSSSKKVTGPQQDHPDLEVRSKIEKAPLTITNDETFSKVVNALLTGKNNLMLSVKADVDVELTTALGTFTVRKIPAQGDVPVKPIGKGDRASFKPKVGGLKIVDTESNSLSLTANVNFSNPTPYSATVPYADINILVNDTILGHATAKDISVKSGNNTNIPITAVWHPSKVAGYNGTLVGRELLSQYISGYNTSLTLRTHNETIPSQPSLGKALASLEIELPTPRLGGPGGGEGDDGSHKGPHFIQDTTMHLVTSTATFVLVSPLEHTTLYLTHVNATAFYHGDAVGTIDYDEPLEVPPGSTETPRLPVEWSLSSVGYDAVKQALGGMLKLSAKANVSVRIGEYEDKICLGDMEATHARRSNSNLSLAHLSIPPLSANPIDTVPKENIYDRSPYHPSTSYVPGSSYIPSGSYYVPSTSYLSGRSAPTTPGILSRSTSPARNSSKSYTQLAFAQNSNVDAALSKTKSAVTIAVQPGGSRRRRKPAQKVSGTDASEWLYRAGAAIAGQTQESKGQSWLTSRASSTSLAAAQRDGLNEPRDDEGADDELGGVRRTYSTRAARDYSRTGRRAVSTMPSRMGSRMASRTGSRVGSRADLARLSALSSMDDTFDQGASGGYFDGAEVAGPDFVDGIEEDQDEDAGDEDAEEQKQEQEVAELALKRGLGLGSMVDRMVGWTMFDAREKGEKSEDEGAEEDEGMAEAQRQARLRKSVSERLTQSTAQEDDPSVNKANESEEASGWQDAAWLMSVASKVLF